ncbi:hypothetical protein J7M28_07945 [bacterium]|nr:hypothetical protein [bacterium]
MAELAEIGAIEQVAESKRPRCNLFSKFVLALLVLTALFAVGIQIYTLVPILHYRVQSAFESGDFEYAMALCIKIRRIQGESRDVEPKMREIAMAGISQYYDESKACFDAGKVHEALEKYEAAMAIADQFFFVFPSQQFLAPKDNKLLARLSQIANDSCFMGKIEFLQSHWARALDLLRDCQAQSSPNPAAAFYQFATFCRTWDFAGASKSFSEFQTLSGMDKLLGNLKASSKGGSVSESTVGDVIPQSMHSLFEAFDSVGRYEIARVAALNGIELVFAEPCEIGSTGISAPCDIFARSAGEGRGDFGNILVDGRDVSMNEKGYNIAAIDQSSGKLISSRSFDTARARGNSIWLQRQIAGTPEGAIVVLTAKEKNNATKDTLQALQSIGATFAMTEPDRADWSHCVIGVKGANPGTALEMFGPAASFAQVFGPRECGSSDSEIKAWLTKRAREKKRPVAWVSGTDPDDRILVAWP